ncbi:MAG: hypothetical protein JRN37_10480 [Nitrososphaerota archaeon]|nr:hypothetical protein [Nitrososphaerota archaeon]
MLGGLHVATKGRLICALTYGPVDDGPRGSSGLLIEAQLAMAPRISQLSERKLSGMILPNGYTLRPDDQ